MILGIAVGFGLLIPTGAYAASQLDTVCADNPDSTVCDPKNKDADPGDLSRRIVNVLLFVLGAISTVMIIVGGVLYTTSAGDSSRITQAKNTILYSIVGLVVAFLAYAIVNFVIKVFIP